MMTSFDEYKDKKRSGPESQNIKHAHIHAVSVIMMSRLALMMLAIYQQERRLRSSDRQESIDMSS
jgi:hypothetical protein